MIKFDIFHSIETKICNFVSLLQDWAGYRIIFKTVRWYKQQWQDNGCYNGYNGLYRFSKSSKSDTRNNML